MDKAHGHSHCRFIVFTSVVLGEHILHNREVHGHHAMNKADLLQHDFLESKPSSDPLSRENRTGNVMNIGNMKNMLFREVNAPFKQAPDLDSPPR